MERPANIYFKVLNSDGKSLEEDRFEPSLPEGRKDGAWHTFDSALGSLLTKNPLPFYQPGRIIYVARFDRADITATYQELIWVSRMRLVRRATNLDLKPFGLYRSILQ